MPVEVADRALEPDRRRMMAADRREAAVFQADRQHARLRQRVGADREIGMRVVRPQAEEIAAAFAERLRDGGPGVGIDVVARPRPVAGKRGGSTAAWRSVARASGSPQLRGDDAEPAHDRLRQPQAGDEHEQQVQEQRHVRGFDVATGPLGLPNRTCGLAPLPFLKASD